jgi:hypothetical protein
MVSPEPTGPDDHANPYAPPQTGHVEQNFRKLRGSPQFSIEEIAAWTWSVYKGRFTHCLGAFWGVFVINWLCQMSIVLVDSAIASLHDQTLGRLSQFASMFGSLVVAVWLTVGQNIAFLKIARGEAITIEHILGGGRYVLTAFLAGIVLVALLAVPLLVLEALGALFLAMLAQGLSAAGLLSLFAGALISIIILIYIFVRLSLFLYVVIDANAGVFSSLAIIWKLGGGRVATIFLAYLLWVTVNLAGFLALCAGLVLTLPLGSLLLAVTYHALADWNVERQP